MPAVGVRDRIHFVRMTAPLRTRCMQTAAGGPAMLSYSALNHGHSMVYSSYLGGGGTDAGIALAWTAQGNA